MSPLFIFHIIFNYPYTFISKYFFSQFNLLAIINHYNISQVWLFFQNLDEPIAKIGTQSIRVCLVGASINKNMHKFANGFGRIVGIDNTLLILGTLKDANLELNGRVAELCDGKAQGNGMRESVDNVKVVGGRGDDKANLLASVGRVPATVGSIIGVDECVVEHIVDSIVKMPISVNVTPSRINRLGEGEVV